MARKPNKELIDLINEMKELNLRNMAAKWRAIERLEEALVATSKDVRDTAIQDAIQSILLFK